MKLKFTVNPAEPYTRVWTNDIANAIRNQLEDAGVDGQVASVEVTLDITRADKPTPHPCGHEYFGPRECPVCDAGVKLAEEL